MRFGCRGLNKRKMERREKGILKQIYSLKKKKRTVMTYYITFSTLRICEKVKIHSRLFLSKRNDVNLQNFLAKHIHINKSINMLIVITLQKK